METNLLLYTCPAGETNQMIIIRSPFFSRWLCRIKREHSSFTWRQLADYLDVSPQCVDSYSTGRAHPQIMRFYLMMEFLSQRTNKTEHELIKSAFIAIKQDTIHKYGKNHEKTN